MTEQTLDTDADLAPYEESNRGLGLLMLIGGAIGLLAAAILIIEKIEFLKNPDKLLSCDINAFVSCGGVINRPEASAFGFPNPIIGVAGFTIVATLGVLLIARVRLPEFVWLGLQAGTIFGIGFTLWLQSQSIFDINKLCPWCMVVWAVTIPIFVWVTARNLRYFLPGNPVTTFVSDWTLLINLLWYVALIAVIVIHFGDKLWA